MSVFRAAMFSTDGKLLRCGHRLSAVVRQFAPNWFAATMGTGIVPIILVQLPGLGAALRPAGEGIWCFDIGLFMTCVCLYGARWALFPQKARRIFDDGTASMYLGTIPMGFATLLSGALAFALPRFGPTVLPIVEVLWWLDAALAIMIGVGVPYLMFTRQKHSIDGMSAIWLLPVAAAEVVATPGAYLAPHLSDPANRLAVITAGYALWGFSIPVCFMIFPVLILRLALHKLPPATAAASSWLALGPTGTGALDLLVFGADAPAAFAACGLPAVGEMARSVGVLGALVIWGLGLWWFALAALITVRYFRSRVPFNLGWWGYTFPLGVYAVVTMRLGALLHFGAMLIFGVVLAVALLGVWALIISRTAVGAWTGQLFAPPRAIFLR